MAKSQHLCDECDVEFRIHHEMEYTVKVLFCPFCGTEIVPEEEYELDDEEE